MIHPEQRRANLAQLEKYRKTKDCCYNGIHITFKHPIIEYKQEEIFKALNADKYVNWCKWTDNKVLIINITPAP